MSSDHSFLVWWGWLHAVCVVVLALGASMVVLPGPTQAVFNLILLGSVAGNASFAGAATAYITFVYAVLGAVMFGWGVLLLYVLRGPFRRREIEGWRMIAMSVVAWFLPDTGYSLWSGFWPNALLNLGLAGAFAIPLALTYRSFLAVPEDRLPSGPGDSL